MRSMKFSASLVRTPRRSYSNGPIRLTHGSSSLPLPAQIPVLYGPGFEPGRPGEKGHVRIWHLPVSDIGKNPLPVLTKSVEHRDGKRGLPDSPIFVDVRTWKTPLPGPGRGVFQAPSRTWKFRRTQDLEIPSNGPGPKRDRQTDTKTACIELSENSHFCTFNFPNKNIVWFTFVNLAY